MEIADRCFGWLRDELGYRVGRIERDPLTWSVDYLGPGVGIRVGVEMRDRYVYVEIWRLTLGRMLENPLVRTRSYDLEDLLTLRAPERKTAQPAPGPLTFEGIEAVLRHHSESLRALAPDVLRGDLAVFAQLREIVRSR